jgi:hypothetical protein
MFIKVEPAGFFMYTVQMAFDQEQPDSEDAEVRGYLAEHELEPRYEWEAEMEGRNCQWLQFGGCYLGGHLQGIGQIQRQAVETELLVEEINRYVDSAPETVAALSGDARQELVAALVAEFRREESFAPDEQGRLTACLDREELAAAARRLLPAA